MPSWEFTKCLVVVYLKSQDCSVYPHLDDWLITAQELFQKHVSVVLDTLRHLSLLITFEKSKLTPARQAIFIGTLLDSTVERAFLPEDRETHIRALDFHLTRQRYQSVLFFQKLLAIWELAPALGVLLQVIHSTNSKNTTANTLSRISCLDHKWSVAMEHRLPVFAQWGTHW